MIIYNHNKGRLGNSLFRLFANIVFLVVYKINFTIVNDASHQNNYNIITDDYFINFMNRLLNGNPIDNINPNMNILFNGYYQHDKIYVKCKQHIINYIHNHPEMILKTDKNDSYRAIDFVNFKTEKKYKIVVHLRLEDFIEISLVIDPNSIKDVIDKINKEYNNETICFVLNKPKTELELKYVKFFTEKYNNIVLESNDVITDYTIMREANVLVCSCSTLSWAAAILSNSLEKVYMPNYKNVHGSHQTCKQPILNTELYEMKTCNINELNNIFR